MKFTEKLKSLKPNHRRFIGAVVVLALVWLLVKVPALLPGIVIGFAIRHCCEGLAEYVE